MQAFQPLGNKKNRIDFNSVCLLVIPIGFEPMTHSLEGCCSIQLSYGTGKIRKHEISFLRGANIKDSKQCFQIF